MPTLPGQNDMEIRAMAERWMQQTELSFGQGSMTSLAYASRIRRWTRWCEASRVRLGCTRISPLPPRTGSSATSPRK